MDVVGCPAGCLVDLDTTIAIAVVLSHAVCHAVDLAQGFAEEFVPVAIKGNDGRVECAGRCVVCYASS